ncbi:MAG TPA: hypothetical protein VIM31_00840 [Candidatus Microsaccharimonas sp.]
MPHEVREVIEHHLKGLEGFPTPEIVTAICEEFATNSHKEKVLKFFLLESPLRARDLGATLCVIGQNRAAHLCQEVARIHVQRLARGKKPLWEEASKS